MKRCPKCNRSFPEENQKFCTVDGGLLITEQTFDPNMTVRATPADLGIDSETTFDNAATSRKLPDLDVVTSSVETPQSGAPRSTGPTGAPTSSPLTPPVGSRIEIPTGQIAEPKKKSKLPLVLGILATLLLLGIGGVAAAFFLVIKPRLDQMQDRPTVVKEAPLVAEPSLNTVTPNNTNDTPAPPEVAAFVPPADATQFANSKDKLEGKLADHYVDFSFYYPQSWQLDPKAGSAGSSNFVKVERMLPPDFTQENFAVGWYTSKGSYEGDLPAFPQLVELLGANLAKSFPGYRKVAEGPTKVNSLNGYEFRFESLSKGTEKGDIQVWGRVVFLPPTDGGQTGATLIMLATSLAPELSGIQDVGLNGEMPVILESFRFTKK
ncbi:MAG: hypothetical protein ABJB97_01740 [Acidobacteriota bacterium]